MTVEKPSYQARLLMIAEAEQALQFLAEDRAELYAEHMADIDTEINVAEAKVSALRASLKVDTLDYVEAGGEPKGLHPAVTYRAKSVLKYDKAAMLQSVLQAGLEDCIRRAAPALAVKKFEAMVKGLDYVWPGTETVDRQEVAIDSYLEPLLRGNYGDNDDGN